MWPICTCELVGSNSRQHHELECSVRRRANVAFRNHCCCTRRALQAEHRENARDGKTKKKTVSVGETPPQQCRRSVLFAWHVFFVGGGGGREREQGADYFLLSVGLTYQEG